MTVYTRAQWGANHGKGSPIGRVGELIVHHTWKPHVASTATGASERSTVRGIERFHAGKGWAGIGYQWLVFQSGRGYEGRGWFRSGAHTVGRNHQSAAICFVINGDEHVPTEAAWDTAREIIADGIAKGALDPDYVLSGHADYSGKSCPGDLVYPIIGEHLSPTLIGADTGGITEAPDPEDDDMFCKFGDRNEKVRALQVLLGYVHGERPEARGDKKGEFGTATATMLGYAIGKDTQALEYGPWEYAGLQKVLIKKFAEGA